MASFSEVGDTDRADFRLLQDGWVTLVHADAVLDAIVAELRALGYRVDTLDCHGLQRSDFIEQVGGVLEFPAYYGKDLDAMNDCLRDLEFPNGAGRAVALRGFDHLVRWDGKLGEAVIDIFDGIARDHMLFGRRLIVLVQSDDPRIVLDLPARRVGWNWREWMASSRGL